MAKGGCVSLTIMGRCSGQMMECKGGTAFLSVRIHNKASTAKKTGRREIMRCTYQRVNGESKMPCSRTKHLKAFLLVGYFSFDFF